MSKDVFNKIMNIVCIIVGVIALAFAITACCMIKDDSKKVTIDNVVADESGNIVITYTDDTSVTIPLIAGADGKSAYELYVESVPEGETPMTEVEWLASLKGTDGANGIGIKNIYFADGEIIIVLDNNTVYKFAVTADEDETPVVPDETPVVPDETPVTPEV